MEADKLNLLRDVIHQASDLSEYRVAFESAGVTGEFMFLGEHASEMRRFASRYLGPFPLAKPTRRADFTVYYRAGSGELASGRHPFWNEVAHEFRLNARSDGTTSVVQRDFVGLLQRSNRTLLAVGPVLDEGTTDSIDNVLQLMFSRCLVAKEALALHAATVVRGGEAFVFFGASGAGKSTLARHCFDVDGARVMAGDQIYLRTTGNRLFAHAAPTTIPEFPRGHEGWCSEPRPVRALIHLVQGPGAFQFRRLTVAETLQKFLRETIYLSEFRDAETLLKISLEALGAPGVVLGEMSYPIGKSFWSDLKEQIHE